MCVYTCGHVVFSHCFYEMIAGVWLFVPGEICSEGKTVFVL